MKKILIVLLAMTFIASISYAGDIEEEIKKLANDNAENYLQPFITAFGTDMNSGLFHTAKLHDILGFDVGIRMMGAMIPDDAMYYDFALPATVPLINPVTMTDTLYLNSITLFGNADTKAPTVFGPDGHMISSDSASIRVALEDQNLSALAIDAIFQTYGADSLASLIAIPVPPGIDFNVMPMVVPQVGLGLPFKTEVLLRWAPTYNVPDVGDIGFFGIGVKHQVSKYIPLCPVDITAMYAYQSLKVGDILTSTHTAFNVHVSKKIPLLITSITPYIGVGFESSSLDVKYTIEGTGNPLIDGTPISFSLDGDNGFRTRVGFSMRLMLFKIYADYALGDYNAYSAGFMLSIR